MTDRLPPFSVSFDLASLGEAERAVALSPSAAERAAIAAWVGIDALDSFSASVRLRRAGESTYEYDGTFTADVTQSCVVTLEPVAAHLEGSVERRFRVLPPRARRRAEPDDIDVAGGGDEEEILNTGAIDLALPVLEEFALAIDPYPRAPGAVFEAPADSVEPTNPFAALEKLKPKR